MSGFGSDMVESMIEHHVRVALARFPRAEALSVGRLARLASPTAEGWAGVRDWLRTAAAARTFKDHIIGRDTKGRPAVYFTRKFPHDKIG